MLNYRIYGDADNLQHPLLVLHGLLGSLDNWHTFASKQQTERSIIAIDMRNHGGSPHVEGMNYRLMVQDVLAVANHLQLDQFDLMGHSMGGKASIWLALEHPERLKKLIVVDIAPVNYPPRHQAIIQAMLTMPLASFKSRKEADQWLAPTIKQPFERAFLLKNLKWDENGKFTWQCNLSEIARHYLSITAFHETDLRYHGPTLFIGGGQSDYLQPERWQIAQTYFPHAHLAVIEEAGHLPHVQTPDIFTEHVNNMLNS